MTDKHVVTALLDRAGHTSADDAAILLADTPAHYKRYDESTATALGEGAELIRAEYRDDLRRLRERAERDPTRIRELLT